MERAGAWRADRRDGSRETEGRRLRGLPDQIVCDARGSARDTSGASLSAPLRTGPAGAVFSSAGSPIITDLIKMKSETGHVGGARKTDTNKGGSAGVKALSATCARHRCVLSDLNKVVRQRARVDEKEKSLDALNC